MAVELLTFKEVSTLFAKLRLPKDTQRIEAHFGWRFTLLKSWFRSLSDLRNLCAHHSRVWNRDFGSRPEMPKRPPSHWPTVPDSIATGARRHPEQSSTRAAPLPTACRHRIADAESLHRKPLGRAPRAVTRPESAGFAPSHGVSPDWETEAFWNDAVKAARSGGSE
jgi:hypothetical protein